MRSAWKVSLLLLPACAAFDPAVGDIVPTPGKLLAQAGSDFRCGTSTWMEALGDGAYRVTSLCHTFATYQGNGAVTQQNAIWFLASPIYAMHK